ncbi:PREDICTED: bifunctional epoxide hydrolase 2 [Tarenaya hassleriana]|uniref:bifunctional epoxide hydrolase 2 n=1 Tax=Tarenaya hassleriana TaxID=28532 RepID=UPI00053C91EA|nr:PREDICTED: bifunctional epoxide hydrolase 2 [Tarenaya hassleriana]
MEGEHLTVKTNGINIHVAAMGPTDGAVVLLLHGFRAVAPDLRGYGDSHAPPEISSYTCFHIVGDLIDVISSVTASDEEKVFVVGHDWGAIMAWYLCLFRADRVKALVNLSIPFCFPPLDPTVKVVDTLSKFYGDDCCVCRFQEPGEVESEFTKAGTERVLKTLFTYNEPKPFTLPRNVDIWGSPDSPIPLPPWLSEDDVRYYVTKFEKTGFSGPVNFYRNLDRNCELLAPWKGSKIRVPTKFVIGDEDLVYAMPGVKEYVRGDKFREEVPLLEESVVMEGVGHFLNQEKPDEILRHIHRFISKF